MRDSNKAVLIPAPGLGLYEVAPDKLAGVFGVAASRHGRTVAFLLRRGQRWGRIYEILL